jgi:cation transport regulator ChaC
MVDSLKSQQIGEFQDSQLSVSKTNDYDGQMFYYFAYGSCMCPVDLKRTLGESTYDYVVGVARLSGYKLGFYYRSPHRDCGCLDIVKDANSYVEGVLYRLPMRLSDRLDVREDVLMGGYQHEFVTVKVDNTTYNNVRTYSVINKLPCELAPNDWYSNVVLRGASTCGLTEKYFWQLFYHIHRLQCTVRLSPFFD